MVRYAWVRFGHRCILEVVLTPWDTHPSDWLTKPDDRPDWIFVCNSIECGERNCLRARNYETFLHVPDFGED